MVASTQAVCVCLQGLVFDQLVIGKAAAAALTSFGPAADEQQQQSAH